jgi:RNA polymerase subunit RPABC4/transcription elongation factor Spt4
VQTCSHCFAQSPDNVVICPTCQADLREEATVVVALKKFQANSRVKNIRLVTNKDCCPACQQQAGIYEKDKAPKLPTEGCSHGSGCRCFYEPLLDEIYP